jgi:hypothetical protein
MSFGIILDSGSMSGDGMPEAQTRGLRNDYPFSPIFAEHLHMASNKFNKNGMRGGMLLSYSWLRKEVQECGNLPPPHALLCVDCFSAS